jgi:hypothetical protein
MAIRGSGRSFGAGREPGAIHPRTANASTGSRRSTALSCKNTTGVQLNVSMMVASWSFNPISAGGQMV